MIRIKTLEMLKNITPDEVKGNHIFTEEMFKFCGKKYNSPEAFYRETAFSLDPWMYDQVSSFYLADEVVSRVEEDPNGVHQHAPGAKLDLGKPRCALVLGGFALALLEISKVGTFGAVKYTDNGWMEVENGIERYDDAGLRHWLYEKTGELCDKETKLLHAAQDAWNALARLELMLRRQRDVEQKIT